MLEILSGSAQFIILFHIMITINQFYLEDLQRNYIFFSLYKHCLNIYQELAQLIALVANKVDYI